MWKKVPPSTSKSARGLNSRPAKAWGQFAPLRGRVLLGSIQDLETLRVQVAAVPSVPDEMRARLEAAIKDTQGSLSSSARRLQRGLFRRGRKAFWGRLGRQLADAGAGSPDGLSGASDHA